MFYVLSACLVALGILVLVVITIRSARLLRRYGRTASMVSASTHDQLGLLRARVAAVKVAIGQRRGRSRTHNG
ncbi:hypothetical protein BAY61_16870 [Prauserella marina]|uniref:Uncharacterized protein n=1 Tax=Prauserella marina TaxID=530584 RepID=A0A222VRP9_9PSEU|nr:bacteriophage holin [Prauserella marina]ASR36401.1 hypothetical protein BAY61_16870 [Prauserella marina]PWV77206.1 hypothetical protein DES30_105423 [Prauserella marina]SDD06873.1 hypothetical protein SAMN05421630_105424 [Prauserella marina]